MVLKEGNINRREIENKLSTIGDYVKMDYLSSCLKKNMDFDTKKFVLTKLSEVYESRKMFLEAGRLIRSAAEINTTFEAKMNEYIKSMDLFIKGGNFEESESSFAKALACADGLQKDRLKARRKDAYKKQAHEYVVKDKRKHAMETFQKYITLPDLLFDERKEAQQELLSLYEKLGKITEYNSLKRSMTQPSSTQVPQPREREIKNDDRLFKELGL